MNRVTNLEQSSILKKIGVKQVLGKFDFAYTEDGLCLCNYNNGQYTQLKPLLNIPGTTYRNNNISATGYVITKAFDSYQIDEMLPNQIKTENMTWHLGALSETGFTYYRADSGLHNPVIVGKGVTKLEAKTNLLISLLKLDIITLK